MRDHEAGVLSDWPEGFAAGVVSAVRYVQRESAAALRKYAES